MSRPSFRANSLVARSMRVSRPTGILSAAIAGGVSVNAAAAVQLIGMPQAALLFVLSFVSVAVGTWAISRDVCMRSAHAISNLRSIGAPKSAILSALLVPVLAYGASSAIVGGLAGGLAGEMAATGGYQAAAIVVYGALMAAIAAMASGVGVLAGVKRSWPS